MIEYTPILDGQRKFRMQSHGRAVPGHHRADAPQCDYIESHLGGDIMKRKPVAQCSIGIEIEACAMGQLRCESPMEAE